MTIFKTITNIFSGCSELKKATLTATLTAGYA